MRYRITIEVDSARSAADILAALEGEGREARLEQISALDNSPVETVFYKGGSEKGRPKKTSEHPFKRVNEELTLEEFMRARLETGKWYKLGDLEQLAEAAGYKSSSVSPTMSKLTRQGELERKERGIYRAKAATAETSVSH